MHGAGQRRAVDAAIEAALVLYPAASAALIRRSSVFDRALRDPYTLGAHKKVQHANPAFHGGATFGTGA